MAERKQEQFEELLKRAPKASEDELTLTGVVMQSSEEGRFRLQDAAGRQFDLPVEAVAGHRVIEEADGAPVVEVRLRREALNQGGAGVPFIGAAPHQAPAAMVAMQQPMAAGLGNLLTVKEVSHDTFKEPIKDPALDPHTIKEVIKEPIADFGTTLKEVIKEPIADFGTTLKEVVKEPLRDQTMKELISDYKEVAFDPPDPGPLKGASDPIDPTGGFLGNPVAGGVIRL
jgi:hypothetical protein